MEILARKTAQTFVFMLELIVGIVLMAAAIIVLPAGIISIDPTLLSDGFVLAVMLAGMAFFAVVGFFGFLRPFLLFRRLPEVQAETDGAYLYIHSRKEAKIPLSDLAEANVDFALPHIMSREFLVQLLSERFGNVTVKVPKYGKYTLYYVANANDVSGKLIALAEEAQRRARRFAAVCEENRIPDHPG